MTANTRPTPTQQADQILRSWKGNSRWLKHFAGEFQDRSGQVIYTESERKEFAAQAIRLLEEASTLPSSLSEIRAIAAKVFQDPAAVTVNVQASFGLVTVNRALEIHMA